MKKIVIIGFLCCFFTMLFAQEKEEEPRVNYQTIVKETIAKLEGAAPIPFRAVDTQGQEHYLEYYLGQVVILQFWNLACQPCLDDRSDLKKIVKDYGNQGVAVLSFSMEEGKELTDYIAAENLNFPVIANSIKLATEAYGGELGFPRIFVIDKLGMIHRVIIPNFYNYLETTYEILQPIIEEQLKL